MVASGQLEALGRKTHFGPYIHHVGGTYGNYKKELREAARYLGMIFDDADEQGIASL